MAQKKSQLRVRRSLIDIENDFKSGKDTATLEKLMVAWQFIKALPPSDPNSFFVIGGYHGEPFAWKGSYDANNYWGGYCNHGNILFPTWHRFYLDRLEKALQSVPGCSDVMLPYWDQTYKMKGKDGNVTYLGVPSSLTDDYFTFSDGVTIPNPLKSFILPEALQDFAEGSFYSKPKGYETVRYPLSGLVGRDTDRAETLVNNSAYYIPGTTTIDNKLTTSLLNQNVIGWLDDTVLVPRKPGDKPTPTAGRGGADKNYHMSLDAPCYTVFSNVVSAGQWNKDNPKALTMAVELPHGEIHLAVGGINAPFQVANPASPNMFITADANGDMGENETAGLDPIFFFHHCNVDRIFWAWQKKHNSTKDLDLKVPGYKGKDPYPGTDNNNNQPPVGYEQNDVLTMDSPLYPFKTVENGVERYYKSSDGFDIEGQMGYTYDNISLDNHDGTAAAQTALKAAAKVAAPAPKSNKVLIVDNIDRSNINGSFVVTAYAIIDGNRYYLGAYPVLSRWRVKACRNCLTHLEVTATFSLHEFTEKELENALFEVFIQGRKTNEAEFARYTIANQTNAAKFLNSRGTANLLKKVAKSLVSLSGPQPIEHDSPFQLQIK